MSRQVIVSYIIITCNSGKTLRQTLDSIQQQTTPKEVIVVDTESDDDTLSIAKTFKVKIIKDTSGNLATVRNLGLDNSIGKYIAFVDSDAILFPKWDRRMVALLKEDNVAGVGCNWRSTGDSFVENAQDNIVMRHHKIIDTNSLATMNVMYDRKRIGDTRFDERFSRASEDVDFNFQLRAKGYRLLFDADKFIRHHNPRTLWGLMKKYYNYGKWFIPPYEKHRQERNRSYRLRFLYILALMFNVIISAIYCPWTGVLLLQLMMPFFAYVRITSNATSMIVNAMKYHAHTLGMIVYIVTYDKKKGVKK